MQGNIATSADVSRNFGEWQDRALKAPVQVTHHGRPRVMLLSVDAYEALRAEGGTAIDTDASQNLTYALKALLNGINEGFIALDGALRITAANALVEAFTGRAEGELLGLPYAALEPANPANDVLVDRFHWVMRAGEPIRFQARTELGGAGVRTCQISAFPYRSGVGVAYHNITRLEVLKDELADMRSERQALNAQRGVAIASLNPMGYFVRANPAACSQFGFEEARLYDVRFADLVRPACRAALLEGMNQVLMRRVAVFTTPIEFVSRDGDVHPAHLSVAATLREENCIGLTVAWQAMAAA